MFLGTCLPWFDPDQPEIFNRVAILIPIVALGLPIADTLLPYPARAQPPTMFSADRAHIHHKLWISADPQQACCCSTEPAACWHHGPAADRGQRFPNRADSGAMGTACSSGSASLAMVFSENPRPCRRSSKHQAVGKTGWATDELELWRGLKSVAEALCMTALCLSSTAVKTAIRSSSDARTGMAGNGAVSRHHGDFCRHGRMKIAYGCGSASATSNWNNSSRPGKHLLARFW